MSSYVGLVGYLWIPQHGWCKTLYRQIRPANAGTGGGVAPDALLRSACPLSRRLRRSEKKTGFRNPA